MMTRRSRFHITLPPEHGRHRAAERTPTGARRRPRHAAPPRLIGEAHRPTGASPPAVIAIMRLYEDAAHRVSIIAKRATIAMRGW
jgi:hypothetical protein